MDFFTNQESICFHILILIILVLSSCSLVESNNQTKPIKEISRQLFDVKRGELVHENEDSVWFEPYERKIPKFRNIYSKNKTYLFHANYVNNQGKLLSNSYVKVIPTENRIDFAPEMQDIVIYEFINYKSDSINLQNHTINPSFNYWTAQTQEGIIENVEEIWIHPIRTNQYKFTEVAPFPEVHFPLEIGKQWESNLNIEDGWGEWKYTSGTSTYEIISKDTFKLNEKILDCWLIYGISTFPFGNSKINYKFNENYGFVEMVYENYESEYLSFRLINITKNEHHTQQSTKRQ